MNWQILSLHFKQTLEGGFRYLDRCGEFLLDAVERLNFVPGEIKPSGAKLEIPERGLTAGVDTTQVVAEQELHGVATNDPTEEVATDTTDTAKRRAIVTHPGRL